MTNISAFLVAHWTEILFYLSVGTALTKVLDKAATRFPALLPFSRVVDELVIDVWDVFTSVAKLIGQPFAPAADAAKKSQIAFVALVSLVFGLLLGCASFGKFAPGTSEAVKQGCTVLDSGNPEIGTLCLVAEEVTSIFSHVKASRSARTKKAGAAPGAPVDVCEGS